MHGSIWPFQRESPVYLLLFTYRNASNVARYHDIDGSNKEPQERYTKYTSDLLTLADNELSINDPDYVKPIPVVLAEETVEYRTGLQHSSQ